MIDFQSKNFKVNLIFNTRFFLLHLAKNIFETFIAHLSLFELSRCQTIMCFAMETKSEKKKTIDFILFHLKFETF